MAKAREREARLQAILVERKDRPCADCGGRFLTCQMDFDHRDADAKVGIASRWVGSEAALMIELEKCDVVCSNCHRARSHQRTHRHS